MVLEPYCYDHYRQLCRTGRVLPLGWRWKPNAFEVVGNIVRIALTDVRGETVAHTNVDVVDYEKVSHLRWSILDHRGYVIHAKSKTYIHRLLTGAEAGLDVDHVDGNTLNNSRSNLRVLTHALNCQNVVRRDIETAPRNVYFWPNRSKSTPWHVRANLNGTFKRAGSYSTQEEAEAVAIELRKEMFTHHNETRHEP